MAMLGFLVWAIAIFKAHNIRSNLRVDRLFAVEEEVQSRMFWEAHNGVPLATGFTIPQGGSGALWCF
jgi:hypothetical protein